VRTAIASHRYAATIGADMELAERVAAEGTPHFFINGRRLVGAQPLEQFTALVEEELVKAKALVARGVSRNAVYDELQKDAVPAR
jgi:predicted DsbA family dithiol-disulfide isomerase